MSKVSVEMLDDLVEVTNEGTSTTHLVRNSTSEVGEPVRAICGVMIPLCAISFANGNLCQRCVGLEINLLNQKEAC